MTGSTLPAVISKQDEKHPGGRPTKYRPEFCDMVIEYGRLGYSRVQMAASLGVSRETLNNWANAHEKFLAALTLADTFSQAAWETKGMMNLNARDFQGHMYMKIMQARFRNDYTEQSKMTVEGGDPDKPLHQKVVYEYVIVDPVPSTDVAGNDGSSS